MCDTLYVPASAANAGIAFFAKNSDRHPDEPQVMTLAAGPRWQVLLSRPTWMRGAEMGINANGVVIGNEAVFPRWKPARNGVTGMETLRRALEECATAAEAVDFIARFVERETQGGNGAYRGKLYYDNSYLVADFSEAWIVETAGHCWAARRLEGPGAISNSYSLRDDVDRADPVTTAERAAPGWSWKRRVESPLYRAATAGARARSRPCRHTAAASTAWEASACTGAASATARRPPRGSSSWTPPGAVAYWRRRREATRRERSSRHSPGRAARRDEAQRELFTTIDAEAHPGEIGRIVRGFEEG
jgi:hypothetical protein